MQVFVSKVEETRVREEVRERKKEKAVEEKWRAKKARRRRHQRVLFLAVLRSLFRVSDHRLDLLCQLRRREGAGSDEREGGKQQHLLWVDTVVEIFEKTRERRRSRLFPFQIKETASKPRQNAPCLSGYRHSYWISNCSGLVNGAGLSSTLTLVTETAAIVDGDETVSRPRASSSVFDCSLSLRRRRRFFQRRMAESSLSTLLRESLFFRARCARRTLAPRGRFLLGRRERGAASAPTGEEEGEVGREEEGKGGEGRRTPCFVGGGKQKKGRVCFERRRGGRVKRKEKKKNRIGVSFGRVERLTSNEGGSAFDFFFSFDSQLFTLSLFFSRLTNMSSPDQTREAALKGAPAPPPPPSPPLHGSEEAAAAAADRTRDPEERVAVAGTAAVGGEGGGGGKHEGRVPGKPAALKPSHYDELMHPKAAEDSAAVHGRDAKKHGHTRRDE